jgi:hypothetical protein
MTLNEFKKLAQEKPVALEVIWTNSKRGPVPWMRGPRRIVAVRSYGFDLELTTTEGLCDPTQKTSALRVEYASLFDLSGDILSIYKSGCRPATEDEQEALDGWDAKVAQDPSITAWAQKNYFRTFVSAKKKADGRRRGYEYLIKDRRGKIDPKTGRELIFDRSFRGDLALQYRVIA